MTSIEVPRADWPMFLDGFAHAHRDWLVNVLLAERAAGDEAGVTEMPLSAILVDEDPSGNASITIEMRQRAGPRASQTMKDVKNVHVLRQEDGTESALAVESESGAQLLLNFIVPQPPEAVDGIPAQPGR
jgi:hypothetical protein